MSRPPAARASPSGGWQARVARRADRIFDAVLAAGAVGIGAMLWGWASANLVPIVAGVGVGVVASAVGAVVRRLSRGPAAERGTAGAGASPVSLPHPAPAEELEIIPRVGKPITARRLGDDVNELDWPDFEGGARRLIEQVRVTRHAWTPDLVIGIRETGIFLADAVTRNAWPEASARPPLGFAYHQGWAGRRSDIRVYLPPGLPKDASGRAGLRVLVVDFLFKTGSALDAVAEELRASGLPTDPDHLRFAVVFVCHLKRVPPAAKPVQLTIDHFPSAETDCRTHQEWLPRLSYVAGVAKLRLRPPWALWEFG